MATEPTKFTPPPPLPSYSLTKPGRFKVGIGSKSGRPWRPTILLVAIVIVIVRVIVVVVMLLMVVEIPSIMSRVA